MRTDRWTGGRRPAQFGDAAAGLAAAHEIGLVHRDIKPENLMRTTKGVTKVVDFGLARSQLAETRFTQQGMLMGTPAYMAPELWMGQEADARSDLYALVLSYYHVLTGQLPFTAEQFVQVGHQHLHEPLPDPRDCGADVPDPVCRILLRGAAKDPADRYSSAAELAADLEALLTSLPQRLTYRTAWEKLGGSLSSITPRARRYRRRASRNHRPGEWQPSPAAGEEIGLAHRVGGCRPRAVRPGGRFLCGYEQGPGEDRGFGPGSPG